VYIHSVLKPKADGLDNKMLSGNRMLVTGLKWGPIVSQVTPIVMWISRSKMELPARKDHEMRKNRGAKTHHGPESSRLLLFFSTLPA
jgi:hypothetical protein